MYLLWWDDRKIATIEKCRAGIAAFVERNNGVRPNVIMIWMDADVGDTVDGCRIDRKSYITLNNIQVGWEAPL